MKLKSKILLLSLITVLAVSCKKYEEGPSLSLRSKKARVANKWKIEKVVIDGDDVTSLQPEDLYWELNKDGGLVIGIESEKYYEGTWEFQNKKEELKIKTTYLEDNSKEEYDLVILMLKENKLKLLVKDDPEKDSYYIFKD